MKTSELISIIHILIVKYIRDEKSKKELEQLIADLVPKAVGEFLERYDLLDPELFATL